MKTVTIQGSQAKPSVIGFKAAAMETLRRELEPLGMRISYSDRVGYFVTDRETSETMIVIASPARFLSLMRKFNASQKNQPTAAVLGEAVGAVSGQRRSL